MVTRIGGFRRKTRDKLKKPIRRKGKINLTNYFQELNDNDLVVLKAEPSIQGGMYFPRFHGKSGRIDGKQGNCYYVKMNDLGKEKRLLVHPVHLKKIDITN